MKILSNSGTITANRAALKVALIYAVFSLLWILFSDQILLYLVKDVEILTKIQMIKGWIFVIITSYIVYVLLYREITLINQGKEVLRIERNNLKNIFEAMKDGVHIINQQYEIQYVNPALQKEFGPFEGLKCFEYFHNQKEPLLWCKTNNFLDGKTTQSEWFSKINNKTYDIVGTPFRNPDGNISKLEIFRDITRRKKDEVELIQHREHLEDLVKERTKELEEKNAELEKTTINLKKSQKSLTFLLEDVNETRSKLKEKNTDLEKFNKLFVDREFRIKELKDKINKLEGKKNNT